MNNQTKSIIQAVGRDLNEIIIFDRSNYQTLTEATEKGAVYTCNINDLDGNMHNAGTLKTALELVDSVLACIGMKDKNLAYILTDPSGAIIDCN